MESNAQKEIMRNEMPSGIVISEDERVLYQAKVSRRISTIFLLFSAISALLGVIIILLGGLAVKENIENPLLVYLFGAFFLVLAVVLIFVLRSTLRRRYILTDKKIIIETGGKMRKSRRILGLKCIKGASLSNNILFSLFDICSIDFYSPSSGYREKSVLIFSFSGTKFKFKFITRKDGEAIYKILQELGYLYE